MKNIALFASGSGTNAENIIAHFKDHKFVNIALVISNKPDAPVIEKAERLGVPVMVYLRDEWLSGENIVSLLNDYHIDFIVLAGFLLRIPDRLLHIYPNNIINIHPSLLPAYGGKGMYGDNVHKSVIEAKEKMSGITIHYINKVYDDGEIIMQQECFVDENDTPEDLARKIHALEYKYYPLVIEQLLCSHSSTQII